MECIVRGHISGSGWKEYKSTGSLCGIKLPAKLRESEKLDEALFTPSTKAEQGTHDENISEAEGKKLLGDGAYGAVRDAAVAIFREACAYAATKGIIIADTKFEFGMRKGEIILIDEVLTPDSSRFWPMEGYAPGKTQPSFDKQYLRNWLLAQDWNMTPPPPALPDEVVRETAAKYLEAYRKLTGRDLEIAL
jgi:phosphoribosylaminoimidazole-succinocarboxamide synthase